MIDWDDIYSGKIQGEKGTIHGQNLRFNEVLKYLEGDNILDVGSGYAELCKRIKTQFPDKRVVALDTSVEAKTYSGYEPYITGTAYELPFKDKEFDLLTCTQTIEYIDDNKFLREALRIAKKAIITTVNGKHPTCSQLREYSENSIRQLIEPYGEIEVLFVKEGMIFAKVKFK